MMETPKSHREPHRKSGGDDSSFPASDPPSSTGITGPRRPAPDPSDSPARAGHARTPHGHIPRREAEPRGQPTSERHRSETAHHPEHAAHKTSGADQTSGR